MKRIYLFFVFVLCIFSTKAFAADYYWTGGAGTSNTNYNNLTNWVVDNIPGNIPTVAPGTNDNVFFTDDAIRTNVAFNLPNIVFNNLTVSATSKDFNFTMTSGNGLNKTLTINGLLRLTNRAKFNSSNVGVNNVGVLIINKTPVFDNNDLQIYLKFNKGGETIKPNSNFKAKGIYVENGVNLDLSSLTIQIPNNGLFKISDATTKINLNNTVLETGAFWIANLDTTSSTFTNLDLKITGGGVNSTYVHSVIPIVSAGENGLVVEIDNLTLPNVTFSNTLSYNRSSIISKALIITNLTVNNTNLFFDTTNLKTTNLTLEKGLTYTFYGTSTGSAPSNLPNLQATNLNFSSSGNTILKSYGTDSNQLAYLDIPALSTYSNLTADNIYSKNVVTFANSTKLNTTVNINITSGIGNNYYWIGAVNTTDWFTLGNWSSSPTANVPVAVLPNWYDNVFFNSRSNSATISINKVVDINDFIVEPNYTGNLSIINTTINPFTIRGSVQLQSNVNFNLAELDLIPTGAGSADAETFAQNGAIIGANGNNNINIKGGGYLKIIGNEFRFSGSPNLILNFISGTLSFETPTLYLGQFNTNAGSNSLNQTSLFLNSSIINVDTWTYTSKQRANLTNDGLLLNAGTSHLYVTSRASLADSGFIDVRLIRNYNDMTLYNTTNSSLSLGGFYNIKNLYIKGNTSFSNSTLNTVSTIENIYLTRGISIEHGTTVYSHTINISKSINVDTDACNSMITINGLNNSLHKINFESTFNPSSFTFNNFVISNLTFTKPSGFIINVNGEITNVVGVDNVVNPTGKNYYWIANTGDNTNQKAWHDPLNWTDNSTGIGGVNCAPTKFDNAIFSNFSGNNQTVVRVNNPIYINNIVFDNTSNPGIQINGVSSRDLYLYGSMYLNTTRFVNFNRILPSGTTSNPTYNATARHEIELKGSDVENSFRFQAKAYYKLKGDFIPAKSLTNFNNILTDIYLNSLADLDASGITIYARSINAQTGSGFDNGKYNFQDSKINLVGGLIIDSGSTTVLANSNTVFNIYSSYTAQSISNKNFYYLGLNPSTTFMNSTLNFMNSGNLAYIESLSTGILRFKEMTLRGTTTFIKSNVTTDVVNSLTNTLNITAGKELLVNQTANLSGTSCDVTRSIVSSVAGTRAKLTILGGDTIFDYLTVKDIDAEGSYKDLVFGTYSTNGGNNSTKVTFIPAGSGASTHGFDAVYACRDITVNNILSADGFHPNSLTTYQWYKVEGTTKTLVATTKDIDLTQTGFGYGTYELVINYDPATAGACIITDDITISQFPTAPNELADDKFCKKDVVTLADVVLPGYDLVWYSAANSLSPLPSTTTIVSGTTYYVARKNQSNNGLVCESTDRFALVLTLDSCGGVYINPALRMRSF